MGIARFPGRFRADLEMKRHEMSNERDLEGDIPAKCSLYGSSASQSLNAKLNVVEGSCFAADIALLRTRSS